MKTKNYLRNALLYGIAVVFAAFVFLATLLKIFTASEGMWCFWCFALVFACFTLGGNIWLLANYLKKSPQTYPYFSIAVWLMSEAALAVSVTDACTNIVTTFSIICIIASVVLFILDGFVYSIESSKDTDLFIAKMNKETDERIAEIKRQSDAFIAEMRKSTDESIANMRKEHQKFMQQLKNP